MRTYANLKPVKNLHIIAPCRYLLSVMFYCMFSVFLGEKEKRKKNKKNKKAHIDVPDELVVDEGERNSCSKRENDSLWPEMYVQLLWCHRTVPHVLPWCSAGGGEVLLCRAFMQLDFQEYQRIKLNVCHSWWTVMMLQSIQLLSGMTLGGLHRKPWGTGCRGAREAVLPTFFKQAAWPEQTRNFRLQRNDAPGRRSAAQPLPALPHPAARWRRGAVMVPRASGGHRAACRGLLLPSWALPESFGGGGRHLARAARPGPGWWGAGRSSSISRVSSEPRLVGKERRVRTTCFVRHVGVPAKQSVLE